MELAVLIGLPASGKSTFCRQVLAPTHTVVSKDAFRNARRRQRRQMRMVHEALQAGENIAVDNTNPSPAEWRPLIEAGHEYGALVTAYWFPPDPAASAERNAARDDRIRVPDVGLHDILRRLRRPGPDDGFDRRYLVRFDGTGGFLVEELAD